MAGVDIPLLIFIGFVILMVLTFIGGVVILALLPGKSKAERRRERQRARRRALFNLGSDTLLDFYRKKGPRL